MESFELAKKIIKILDEKKGEEIRFIRISELTVLADYFIIVNGTSITHVRALAEEVEEETAKLGVTPRNIEGRSTGWILLDYGDVVVHLFEPETREFYALEDLWGKGEEVPLEDVPATQNEKKSEE